MGNVIIKGVQVNIIYTYAPYKKDRVDVNIFTHDDNNTWSRTYIISPSLIKSTITDNSTTTDESTAAIINIANINKESINVGIKEKQNSI